MARQPTVWLRKKTGWYYTTIDRKKIRLSRDKSEATQAFYRLMAEKKEKTDDSTNAFPSFRKIADKFLENSKLVNKPTTYRMHKQFIQSFVNVIKGRRIADLRVLHVTDWINTKKDWGHSTGVSARGTILAALNWAVTQGYITSHPLTKLKRGSHKRRERVFTADELQKIREFTNPRFRDFLRALELTGARPFSELATVTASMIDWEQGIIPLGEHKNEKKGKTRTIYLLPELTEILKRLAEKYPEGPLFRNNKGKMWNSHDAVRRLHFCTTRLGIPKGTIYAVRHFRINSALEKGMTANVIAELVGNSPITIARHYDHLSKQKASMKEAALRAVS